MKRGGLVAGFLVLVGMALSVQAVVDLSFASSAAHAPKFAGLAWIPFVTAAGLLFLSGKRRTAIVVAVMAPLNLLTDMRGDGSGLILQIAAAVVAAWVAILGGQVSPPKPR